MASPRYPNQQLRSVSFETFFRGRLDAVVRMGEVQSELGERFPNLLVPNFKVAEAPALRPAQLRSEDGTRALALAINQATYIAFDYPGHEAFIAEATQVLTGVLSTMRVGALTRAVYRYDNAIDMPRDEEACLPLEKLLALRLPSWTGDGGFRQLGLEWTRVWKRGEIWGKLFHEDQGPYSTLRIEISASIEPAGPVAGLASYASAAHAAAVGVFEGMITERFREFLRLSPEAWKHE